MTKKDLFLLDCTLRDGGYVNDWKWGYHTAKAIIRALIRANVDIVEVGFLRNVETFDDGITACNTIEELNRFLPEKVGGTIFSAMAMHSNYDIKKLSPYSGKGIEIIRVTAHENDIKEGLKFAEEVQNRGYKVSINPINIMGYRDEKLIWIIRQVNRLNPYQFSIVDTFGSMKRRDLDRIVSLVDNNLSKNIRLALHLHENMSLSCLLAQKFIDMHLKRPIAIDGSLMGMGRIPGNLPIELIADYLNEYCDTNYDIDYLMDAIQAYIAPLKGEVRWGYTPAYFISAKFNLHRNYAEYYLLKGDLSNSDINHILSKFDENKAAVFDSDYAELQYQKYKSNQVDDIAARNQLKKELIEKDILILAPGSTIDKYENDIIDFINDTKVITISTNFIPKEFQVDYAFFCNNKRYRQIDEGKCKVIATSNIRGINSDYYIDYNNISNVFPKGSNSFVMLLQLLKELGVEKVFVAGADGYKNDQENYYHSDIRLVEVLGDEYNHEVSRAIKKIGIDVVYITPSQYTNIY